MTTKVGSTGGAPSEALLAEVTGILRRTVESGYDDSVVDTETDGECERSAEELIAAVGAIGDDKIAYKAMGIGFNRLSLSGQHRFVTIAGNSSAITDRPALKRFIDRYRAS